jgi:hypothetical protein
MASLTQADFDQIESFRTTATPEETAKFAAELYKIRNTASANFFTTFPRWLILMIAVWFGLLETAEKLPMILLSFPRYQAELAEAQAKLLQPDLLRAQLTKAENEATASKLQPEMTKTQLARAKNEAEASEMQPDLISLQVNKARLDATIAEYAALAAHYQPHMAGVSRPTRTGDHTT